MANYIPPVLLGEKSGRNYGAAVDGDTASRIFLVRSNNRNDHGTEILFTPGIPLPYDYHPTNPTLRALQLDADQDSGVWWKWTVTVEYTKPEDDEDENPLNRDPEITFATESFMVAVVAEANQSTGNPEGAIANSAGEPLDPPPETEEDILIVNITRNETNEPFSVVQFYNFTNSLNSDSFTFGDATFQPGQVKLRITIGKREEYVDQNQDITYYRSVSYMIAANPRGWDLDYLDQGSYYKDGDTEKPFEVEGERTVGLLDGSGGKLADGAMAIFLNKKIKKRVAFSTLNLPAGP